MQKKSKKVLEALAGQESKIADVLPISTQLKYHFLGTPKPYTLTHVGPHTQPSQEKSDCVNNSLTTYKFPMPGP